MSLRTLGSIGMQDREQIESSTYYTSFRLDGFGVFSLLSFRERSVIFERWTDLMIREQTNGISIIRAYA